MTAEVSDASVVGQLIDAAILVSDDGVDFHAESDVPDWYIEIFGESNDPGINSPFLAGFLELVRSCDEAEKKKSGLWEECSGFFEAVAIKQEGRLLLMVERADERHDFEQQILHSNHLHELNREQLQKELELKKILLECVMHDLANPAAVLLMNLQHIERNLNSGNGQSLRPAVERAINQVNRQKQLIQSISDVFGAETNEAGESKADQLPDLSNLAAEAAEEMKTAAGKRGVDLLLETPEPGGTRVKADPLYVKRVLDNVIGNALRHSPENGKIRISVDRKGRFAKCRISDEGSGFGKDLADPFKAFSQGTSNAGSSGLGLYFSKLAVEMFGGTVKAENNKDGGAAVTLILPLSS